MPLNEQRTIHESRGGVEIACAGKVRFMPAEFNKALKVARRMAHSKHLRIMPFRCPHCDGWHVGRQMARR